MQTNSRHIEYKRSNNSIDNTILVALESLPCTWGQDYRFICPEVIHKKT